MNAPRFKIVSDASYKKLLNSEPPLDTIVVGYGRTSFDCLYHAGTAFIRAEHAELILGYVVDLEIPETYQ